MQIKIKFTQSELKKRSAKILGLTERDIVAVSPTLGGVQVKDF